MLQSLSYFSVNRLLRSKKAKKSVDKLAYFVGVAGNAAALPQIIRAWQDDAPGLAISTWIMFMVIGVIWLLYAIMHHQKPLIVAQLVGLTANTLVVAGWLFQKFII